MESLFSVRCTEILKNRTEEEVMTTNRTNDRREMLRISGASLTAAGLMSASLLQPKEAEAVQTGTPHWVMIMDLRRCTGCRACTVSCKAEYDVPIGAFRTVIKQVVTGQFPETRRAFMPRRCNHCEGTEKIGNITVPPCVKACPEYPKDRRIFVTPEGKKIRYRGGATYKRPDGLILIDNDACTGCGKCIDACPYGARTYNKRKLSGKDKTKNAIVKCSSCVHRLDEGVTPACVNTCAPGARIFGDLNDPNSEVAKLAKEFKLLENRDKSTLKPGAKTMPNIFYIDPDGVLADYSFDDKKKLIEYRDIVE
jgi:tetrathionate reductase subunit B